MHSHIQFKYPIIFGGGGGGGRSKAKDNSDNWKRKTLAANSETDAVFMHLQNSSKSSFSLLCGWDVIVNKGTALPPSVSHNVWWRKNTWLWSTCPSHWHRCVYVNKTKKVHIEISLILTSRLAETCTKAHQIKL